MATTLADVEYNPNFTVTGSRLLPTGTTDGTANRYGKVQFDVPSDADRLAVRAFHITNTGGTAIEYLQQYTKISGGSSTIGDAGSLGAGEGKGGKIDFIVKGAVAASTSITLTYYIQPKDNTRGDFEATDPLNPIDKSIKIPSVDIRLSSENVVAVTRKLQGAWTPELAQDFSAYHGMDAEAEILSILSEQISLEVDKEILDMLIVSARTTSAWSAQSNKFFNDNSKSWSTSPAGAQGFYNTQGEWFKTLGTKVQAVSNKIYTKTLRGNANFLVTSPDVCTILESIPGFSANTDGTKAKFTFGAQKAGSLHSRYDVYKVPYFEKNTILIGYKGSNFLETGAVYAPYIPLISTPVIYDTQTYVPRKGLMTRYAKHIVRPEFYGKINVYDLGASGALD